MSLYTLMLATVVNFNKELPVKGGLSLSECRAAALEALLENANYARCRPTQPESPVVFVKLPTGMVVEVQRQFGGYRLPPGHSIADEEFFATVLGRPSSGAHTRVHGPARDQKTATASDH
jgi:hypothetical protein